METRTKFCPNCNQELPISEFYVNYASWKYSDLCQTCCGTVKRTPKKEITLSPNFSEAKEYSSIPIVYFPIQIDENMENTDLDLKICPPKLYYIFLENGIRQLKSLKGLTPKDFFKMKGFGKTRLTLLIEFLKAVNAIAVKNYPGSHKKKFGSSARNKPASPNISNYIIDDNVLFLQIINIIRFGLNETKREIFDYRIFPQGKILTLEVLGVRLNLTRERVRQIEKIILTKIRHETYYPAVYFRRRVRDIYQRKGVRKLLWEELLSDPFFYGLENKGEESSSLEYFIQKVFPEAFKIEAESHKIELIVG
jgi:hypothetical protein